MKNSDKKLPPQVQFNFMEDEEVDTDTNENNPNFVYSEEAEGNDLKELEFQEKPLINKKEIFEGNDTDEEEEIIEDVRLNITGLLKVINQVRRALLKSQQASIVLFSSVAAQIGFQFHTQVAISKGGIEALSKTLAAELAPKVRVNVVAPSITKTPLSEHLLNNEKKMENNLNRHPLQRIGEVDDIVNVVELLIDDKSQWITGQIFNIDGGISSIKI